MPLALCLGPRGRSGEFTACWVGLQILICFSSLAAAINLSHLQIAALCTLPCSTAVFSSGVLMLSYRDWNSIFSQLYFGIIGILQISHITNNLIIVDVYIWPWKHHHDQHIWWLFPWPLKTPPCPFVISPPSTPTSTSSGNCWLALCSYRLVCIFWTFM